MSSTATRVAQAREALARHFGYPDFRPGQIELVQAALEARDALGILPTGGGKSLCYQVPAVLLPHLTVVVSPLISLMVDQAERCEHAGIPAAFLNATVDAAKRRRVEAAAASGELRVLFLAPERLESRRFLDLAARLRVSLLAVDEAHCISEWGHDFRPSYLRVARARSLFGAPVLALTATATPRTRQEIISILSLRDPVTVVGGFDRPNLSWEVRPIRAGDGKLGELGRLVRGNAGTTIVYAGSRRGVEVVRDHLAALGRRTEAYHAGLSPFERDRVQSAFMAGRAPTVVATNAFGMGIDKSDVRLVVHHELPRTLEAYYQEAGRAGRDGDHARCIALSSRADRAQRKRFVDRTHPQPRVVRHFWRTLRARADEGGSVDVPVSELRARDGTPLTPADVGALARALVASRAVRLRTDPPEEPDGLLSVRLRTDLARPALAAARRRRKAEMGKLAAVDRYARTSRCRRAAILGYFGEIDAPAECGACDNCVG